MSAARSLCAVLLAVLPLPLAGQIPIRVSQAVTGRLTISDQQFRDGSRYKMYAFVGNKGDSVTADMTSDDLDPNLILADADGNPLIKNDDGGGNCNARISYVLPAAGNYRLYANSSAQAELGEYRLSLKKGRTPAASDTTCHGFGQVAGLIQVGQTVNGQLTTNDPLLTSDSSYYQRWILPLEANQAVTVDLESDDFDAYLILTKGRGEKLAENDDGGGGCNARLVWTAQDDHPVRVVVNTARKLQTGKFIVRVTEGMSPVEPKGTCRFRTAAAAAAPSSAPAPPSAPAPSAAPAGGMRPIRVGQTVTGELTASDSLYADTTYYQFWQFTAPRDTAITIDLASDDFDPVLIIRGLDSSVVNDDGGPGCASRVSMAFPGTGPYTILVNTTSDPYRQAGRFTLSITRGHKDLITGPNDCHPPHPRTRGAPQEAAAEGHVISVGQSVQGQLTRNDHYRQIDSTYSQRWQLNGTTGETVTIDLESNDFDPYVFVAGPGIADNLQDDDSGGNCNARLTVTFAQSGTFLVMVNTTDHNATGAFSLSVTAGSKPKSLARCNRNR